MGSCACLDDGLAGDWKWKVGHEYAYALCLYNTVERFKSHESSDSLTTYQYADLRYARWRRDYFDWMLTPNFALYDSRVSMTVHARPG